jgi:hypothetical protein
MKIVTMTSMEENMKNRQVKLSLSLAQLSPSLSLLFFCWLDPQPVIGPHTLVSWLLLSSSLSNNSAVRWRYCAHKVLPLVSNETEDKIVSEGGSNYCTAVGGDDVLEEALGDEDDVPAASALPGN